jgi:molybdopterin/thiamine biosynthesis adenylyltransferase
LVEDGTDLFTVKELLGHADYKMTSRYSHIAANGLRAAVRRLDKAQIEKAKMATINAECVLGIIPERGIIYELASGVQQAGSKSPNETSKICIEESGFSCEGNRNHGACARQLAQLR